MQYKEFKNKVKNYPVFRSNIFTALTNTPHVLRNQIVNWTKQGLVIALKRGLYTLNNDDRKVNFSNFFLAQELYSPSYISLESALSYYGFIPEKVVAITSITTKKTQKFSNSFGHFIYRHLKTPLFNDFIATKDEYGNNFYLASPEKAMIDFLYFQTRDMTNITITADIFDASFRFQNIENLDSTKLLTIANSFKNKKLCEITIMLCKYLENLHA